MSMLTVAELVADPESRVGAGGRPRGADREIEAAAVSELAHPGPWLQGGELLLTIGLLLPDSRRRLPVLPHRTRRRRSAGRRAGPGRRPAAPGGAGAAGRRGRRDRHAAADRAGPGAVHRGHQGGVRAPGPRRAAGIGVGVADPAGAHRRRCHARAACSASSPRIARRPAAPASSSTCSARVLAESDPGGERLVARLPGCSTRCAGRGWPPRPLTSATAAAASCTRSGPAGYGRGC